MESIVSSWNGVIPLPRATVNTVTTPKHQRFVLLKSQIQRKQLIRYNYYWSSCKSNSKSRVSKSSIRCGAITEIDESQFGDVVLKSERPVLVEFVANWCGPCRLIAPAMESLAQEYGDRLTIVKIDHDANPKLIEAYKVYGLPTLILFKNGQEVPESRREGAITKVKLKEYINSLLSSTSIA